MKFLKDIYMLYRPEERFKLFSVIFLCLFVSFVEVLSLSLLVPFIAIALNPTLIQSKAVLSEVFVFLGFADETQFVVFIGLVLIFFFLLRAMLNFFQVSVVTKLANQKQWELKNSLFSTFIGLPFEVFKNSNSAEYSKDLMVESNHVTPLILSFLNILTELMVVTIFLVVMLVVDYKISLGILVVSSLLVLAVQSPLKAKLSKIGQQRAELVEKMQRIINEAFSNFTLVKLTKNEKQESGRFKESSSGHRDVISSFLVWTVAPKFLIEFLGFSLVISIVIYVLLRSANASHVIGVIGIYAVAFYRLLPSLNKLINNWNQIRFYSNSLSRISCVQKYNTEILGNKELSFKQNIVVEKMSHSYGDNIVLDSVSVVVKKMDKVALIGPSGSGKSTFVSILMGLQRSQKGKVTIDGECLNENTFSAWRGKIGYIPQDIYLFDGSIADNVTYGRVYSEVYLVDALKAAKIYDFVMGLKEGWNSSVGEGGGYLSGGQKQRLAIARAIYDKPELLVLDEATSALDSEVESEIMQEIYRIAKDRTLLVIAHRTSTIYGCSKVFEFSNGKINIHNDSKYFIKGTSK